MNGSATAKSIAQLQQVVLVFSVTAAAAVVDLQERLRLSPMPELHRGVDTCLLLIFVSLYQSSTSTTVEI